MGSTLVSDLDPYVLKELRGKRQRRRRLHKTAYTSRTESGSTTPARSVEGRCYIEARLMSLRWYSHAIDVALSL